jgi:hypothetical protein
MVGDVFNSLFSSPQVSPSRDRMVQPLPWLNPNVLIGQKSQSVIRISGPSESPQRTNAVPPLVLINPMRDLGPGPYLIVPAAQTLHQFGI